MKKKTGEKKKVKIRNKKGNKEKKLKKKRKERKTKTKKKKSPGEKLKKCPANGVPAVCLFNAQKVLNYERFQVTLSKMAKFNISLNIEQLSAEK